MADENDILGGIHNRSLFDSDADILSEPEQDTETRGSSSLLLGQIAINSGYITSEQLEEALKEQRKTAEQLGTVLYRMKFLTSQQLTELLRKQVELVEKMSKSQIILSCKRCNSSFLISAIETDKIYRCPKCSAIMVFSSEAFTTSQHDTTKIKDATADLPQDVREAIRDKKNIIGKYVLLDKLGGGGGGDVYRAFDLVLERTVALKLFAVSSEIDLQRTRVEAQLCAKLKHPGIPQIHEFGSEGSVHFMAMEFIDGKNLQQFNPDLPTALTICRDIALVLQHAHEQGIVHRDVKPSNILVDGSGRAYLTDFGIARAMDGVSTSQRTKSGEIKGTPAYMSPEQALGRHKEVDQRTDVFSLGTTLYFLSTGVSPFDAATFMDIVKKITTEDPAPPRKLAAGISAEVESIIMKAVEKERDRRYQSARDFADDIDKYLHGEPIIARPAGTMRKVYVAARRRRKILAFIALALCVGFAVFLVVDSERTRRDEAIETAKNQEQEAKKQMERTQTLVNIFLDDLAKAHRKALQWRMNGEKYEQLRHIADATIETFNNLEKLDIANANVHYTLGRLYRMIGEDANARLQQISALAKEPEHPGALYEMGILTYREFRARIESIRDKRLRETAERWFAETRGEGGIKDWHEPAEDELADDTAAKMKASAAGFFKRAGSKFCVSTDEKRVCSVIVEALDGNLLGLESVIESMTAENYSPTHEDAAFFLSRSFVRAGEYAKALTALGSALAIDRGNELLYLERGLLYSSIATSRLYSTGDPTKELKSAVEDFTRASQLRPEKPDAWMARGVAYNDAGIYKMGKGEDPGTDYTSAIRDYDEALKLGPNNGTALMRRGMARMNLLVYSQTLGSDPVEGYQHVIADFDAAQKLDPEYFMTFSCRGVARLNMAMYLSTHGADATTEYAAAVGEFESAIRLNPGYYFAWLSRGVCRSDFAYSLQLRGKDPEPTYAQAAKDFEGAINLNSGNFMGWLRKGGSHMNWGIYLQTTGRDPAGQFLLAESDLTRAVEINRKHYEPLLRRGLVLANWGVHYKNTGKDPTELYGRALADYDDAIKLNDSNFECWLRRGMLRNNMGVFKMNSGGNAAKDFDAAILDTGHSIELNTHDYESHLWRGLARMNRAIFREKFREDPSSDLNLAISDFDESAKLNPASFEPVMWRGNARGSLLQAVKLGLSQGSLDEIYSAAISDMDVAVRMNPGNGESYMRRGLYHYLGENYVKSLPDFEKGAQLNPNLLGTFQKYWDDAKIKARSQDY